MKVDVNAIYLQLFTRWKIICPTIILDTDLEILNDGLFPAVEQPYIYDYLLLNDVKLWNYLANNSRYHVLKMKFYPPQRVFSITSM